MIEPQRYSRKYLAQHRLWQLIDWIYPPHCATCGKSGIRWCDACKERVKLLPSTGICPLCGIPQPDGVLCAECAAYQPVYTNLRSWGVYEGVLRTAIHRLKYHNDIGLSQNLARPLTEMLDTVTWNIDLVTAVPLSGKRRRERGYNQAALLARWVGLTVGLPFAPSILQRLRDTTSQVGLHADQRRQNVAGAFHADSAKINGRSVLVIDDVTTTGATMQACAQALMTGGAREIYGLTLARAGQIHLS